MLVSRAGSGSLKTIEVEVYRYVFTYLIWARALR